MLLGALYANSAFCRLSVIYSCTREHGLGASLAPLIPLLLCACAMCCLQHSQVLCVCVPCCLQAGCCVHALCAPHKLDALGTSHGLCNLDV